VIKQKRRAEGRSEERGEKRDKKQNYLWWMKWQLRQFHQSEYSSVMVLDVCIGPVSQYMLRTLVSDLALKVR
jgi:hypothetical protein